MNENCNDYHGKYSILPIFYFFVIIVTSKNVMFNINTIVTELNFIICIPVQDGESCLTTRWRIFRNLVRTSHVDLNTKACYQVGKQHVRHIVRVSLIHFRVNIIRTWMEIIAKDLMTASRRACSGKWYIWRPSAERISY